MRESDHADHPGLQQLLLAQPLLRTVLVVA